MSSTAYYGIWRWARCSLIVFALSVPGCVSFSLGTGEVPCAKLSYFSGLGFDRAVEVEIYRSNVIRLRYANLVDLRKVHGVKADELCAELGEFDSVRFGAMLLQRREQGPLHGVSQVLIVSGPCSEEVILDLWHEKVPVLMQTKFGDGIERLDRVLRDQFQKLYCIDKSCRKTLLTNVVERLPEEVPDT